VPLGKDRPTSLQLASSAGLTLQIRELRGFKEGTKPEYDALLLGKEEYYNALSASIPRELR